MKPDDLDCELYLMDRHQASLRIGFDGPEHSGRPTLDDALLASLRASLDPREYGKALFEALLPPGSDLLFGYRQALAVAANAKRHLRFRLHLAAHLPAELHSLRWEQLHDSWKKLTFGCSGDVSFSRSSSVPWATPGEVREKPRLLVALADPSNLAEFPGLGLPSMDRAEARRSIEEALEPLRGLLYWEILKGPITASRLSDRLMAGGFHALHLQAHGVLRPDRASASLILEGSEGEADFVNEDILSEIFEGARDLRLVTLIACHGGTPSSDEPLSGLGPGLVRRGVPAVVAMRQDISFTTAASFCQHFYDNLARSGCVDRAVNKARHQLSLSLRNSDEWGTPILFMRLKDGRLWEPKSFQPPGTPSTEVKWPALLSRIPSGEVVPFLGPGLYQGLLPSPSEIADRWAGEYPGFPLDGRLDLPAVAQFVEFKKGRGWPRNVLPALLAKELLKRLKVHEPSRYQNLRFSELINKFAERYFDGNPDEPHRILASLHLPLYVTTNVDGFMASALGYEGKEPTVEYCRWNKGLDELPASYQELQGTSDKPVVFHLYGNDADRNSIVLTEDDYLEFLRAISMDDLPSTSHNVPRRLPLHLKSKLTGAILLFLGYDVRRLDCRVLLRGVIAQIRETRAGRDSRIAVLQIDPKEEDSLKERELMGYMESCCQPLNFEFYKGSARDFLRELRDRLKDGSDGSR